MRERLQQPFAASLDGEGSRTKGCYSQLDRRRGKGAIGTESGRRPGVYGLFLMAAHFGSAADSKEGKEKPIRRETECRVQTFDGTRRIVTQASGDRRSGCQAGDRGEMMAMIEMLASVEDGLTANVRRN
jgi:hypothetical protein